MQIGNTMDQSRAIPWELKITALQTATMALLVAGVALCHATGGSF